MEKGVKMIADFNEITLEDLMYISKAVIDGDKRIVLIGVKND